MNPFEENRETVNIQRTKNYGGANNHNKRSANHNEEAIANLRQVIEPLESQIKMQIKSHNERLKYPNGIPTLL